MNITTFNLQKLMIESLTDTNCSITERYMLTVLFSQLNQELETDSTDVQIAKKVGCSDRMIRNIITEKTILSIFEIDRVKHKTTFYKLKAYSFMTFATEQLKDSKDKFVISIIESFKNGDLTINGKELNHYQNDLFIDIANPVKESEDVKEVVKKEEKKEKEKFAYTKELKEYFDKNAHAKGSTSNYFIIAQAKIKQALAVGYTIQQVFEEEQRFKKGFAYSVAVMLKNKDSIQQIEQPEQQAKTRLAIKPEDDLF